MGLVRTRRASEPQYPSRGSVIKYIESRQGLNLAAKDSPFIAAVHSIPPCIEEGRQARVLHWRLLLRSDRTGTMLSWASSFFFSNLPVPDNE